MGKISRALEKSLGEYSPEAGNEDIMPEVEQPSEDNEVLETKREIPDVEGVKTVQAQPPSEDTVVESSGWDERFLKVAGFSGVMSESFRVLRTRIIHPADDGKKTKTVLVTSAAPEEGKSFVAANLAVSIARGMDKYCLVVDCDLRRPALAGLFGMKRSPGLSNYLQKAQNIPQVIQKTSVDKLTLLASGDPPAYPSELLGSERMQGLVQELSARYDDRVIIFDSPPVKVASETLILAQQVDSVVLVVRWGASGREHVKKIIEDIGKEKIVGVVFNGYKSNIVESKMLKYSNYYYYDYASKNPKSHKKI